MKKIIFAILTVMVVGSSSFGAEKTKEKEVTICVDWNTIQENEEELLCGINLIDGAYSKRVSLSGMYKNGWRFVGSYRITNNIYNGHNALILERDK